MTYNRRTHPRIVRFQAVVTGLFDIELLVDDDQASIDREYLQRHADDLACSLRVDEDGRWVESPVTGWDLGNIETTVVLSSIWVDEP